MCRGKIINCYWGTWSYYRPGSGSFGPEDIDVSLCTHLSYCFFGIDDSSEIKILDRGLDIDKKFIRKAIALKQKKPSLKIIAVVGGWNEGTSKFSAMAADPRKRAAFVSSAVQFLREHGFDGLDIDWEYPASSDRDNFVRLIRELCSALEPRNLELSIAVGASRTSESYNIREIVDYVDYINLMTYDYHSAADGFLGHNAPMPEVKQTVDYWLQRGAPARKLILGIAFYGKTFTMANRSNRLPGARCSAVGDAGAYTREAGLLSYYEIRKNNWTSYFDKESKTEYAVRGDQWVSYDDPECIEYKTQLILDRELGGAMAWSLNDDDFNNGYPLLSQINASLQSFWWAPIHWKPFGNSFYGDFYY